VFCPGRALLRQVPLFTHNWVSTGAQEALELGDPDP